MMDVLVAQFLCLFGLFLSMIAFTLLPMWIVPSTTALSSTTTTSTNQIPGLHFVNSDRYESFVGLANCLSGGVFLATFFIGLLPEVRHEMNSIIQEAGLDTTLPPTELIVVLGFFLAMFVEQIAMSVKGGGGHAHCHSHDTKDLDVPETNGHGHSHDVEALLDPSSSGVIRFGILFISLGVHSLFEGMALGLQTEVHILFNLFVGVWIHECLIAFALGFSLLRAMTSSSSGHDAVNISKCHFFRVAVLFSALIPAGQLLGLIVGSSRSWTSRVLNAVLQAIAAGTFIQVTFLDIIPEGLEGGHGHRAAKISLILLGFICIAVITYFVQSHHVH